MRRIAAVAGVAGKERIVAEVFARAGAIGAATASVAKPRNADALIGQEARYACAGLLYPPDDFVSRHNRAYRVGQFSVDDMEIGATDATGLNPQPDFAGAGRWQGARLFHERRPWRVKRHRRHCSGRDRPFHERVLLK